MTTYRDGVGQLRCNTCLKLAADCRCRPPQRKAQPMFSPNVQMLLTNVEFTTETVDEETRRIVVCTFQVTPLTAAQADDLHVRSVLFDATTGQPKEAIEAIVLQVDMPLQRLTFAMAPDQTERRIVIDDVKLDKKVRAKIKHDRDPLMVEATLKISFYYPTADELLYIANGVNDSHYLTFEPEQGDLLDEADAPEELRPGIFAEH